MSGVIWSKGGEVDRFCLLVHGGAGSVAVDRRALHVEGCRRAARIGAAVLREGGDPLRAVEAAVRVLEDDPVFNAGTGAALNADGRVELDASIMEGAALRAGAVCSLNGFAAPISIARAALEDGRHVLYAAAGARAFAIEKGFIPVDGDALITTASRAAFESAKKNPGATGWAGGTVGAVALAASGRMAAATSTGGTINKLAGRVGDSPLIGAGTYADDEAGAISTTGHGEGMIRISAARLAVFGMSVGQSAEDASRGMLQKLFDKLGVTGGAIALDRSGRFGLARSTETMSWAAVTGSTDEAGI